MRSRIGSTILLGLLYSQAAFGLVALGAVAMKDDALHATAPAVDASPAVTLAG